MSDPAFQDIIYSREGGFSIITLNRPDNMNAFSLTMLEEIHKAINLVEKDEKIRVLVITGTGRAFCTGADVKAMAQGQVAKSLQKSFNGAAMSEANLSLRLRNLEKPVIAAINGYAVGGGLDFALSCDIRIASDQAKLAEVFIRRGLVPVDGGTHFLPALVPIDKACDLIWTGDMVEAHEALTVGLVTKVVPHIKLMESTKGLAGRIAENNPLLLALSKRLIYKHWQMSLERAVDSLSEILGLSD